MTSIDTDNPFLRLRVRAVFLWSLIIFLSLTFVVGFIGAFSTISLNDPIFLPIVYIAFFGLLCGWLLNQFKRLHINPSRVIGTIPQNLKWFQTLGLMIAVLLFSLGAFLISFYPVSLIAPDFVESILQENTFQTNSGTLSSLFYNILMGVVIVIVAPIAEEFVFRGVLLQRWAVKWNVRVALIASSLIFGILHANVVGLSVFGLVMGVLYIRTRSLLVPIACHAFNNALALAMGFLPNASDTSSTLNTVEDLQSQWWVGIVLMAIALPWLIRFFQINYPKSNTPIPYFANAEEMGLGAE